jgi:hypothetical protein
MTLKKVLLTLLLYLFMSNAYSASWLCRGGLDNRTIDIIYPDPDGKPLPCHVLYGKNNDREPRKLWESQNTEGYCKAKVDGLLSKLEKSGFRCSIAEPKQ